MVQAFIKIFLRDIIRNKTYFLIKTLGLTIGMACFIFIFSFVQYEKSYDTFHDDYQSIYRIIIQTPGEIARGSDIWCSTPGPLVPVIKEEFPEILSATRVFKRQRLVRYMQTSSIEDRVLYVDPDFLKLFSFRLLAGNPEDALNNPNSIILTKRSAKKYFGNEDPVGKTIFIDEDIEYLVTGIIEDAPGNSHMKFDFLSTINTSLKYDSPSYHWNSSPYQTYIRFSNLASVDSFEEKLNNVVDNHRDNNRDERFLVQALADIHLNSDYNSELEVNGDKSQIYSFLIIGLLTLLIACFNYINLTSAYSLNRLKAVGTRKVIGENRFQFYSQVIGESTIYVLISSFIAILLVKKSLPHLNSFLQKEISFQGLFEFKVLSGILLSIMAISFLSGLIPAFIISRSNPVQILKNRIPPSKKRFISLRSSFVVTQFIISIMLINGALLVYQQLKYLQNKDLGFQKENIINTYLYDENCRVKYQAFKNELLKHSGILDVTISNYLPDNITGQTNASLEGQTDDKAIYYAQVDNNFLHFYGIELKEGNTFSENTKNDLYILNRAAVESFGLKSTLGESIKINGIDGNITGVIGDIYFSPLHLKVDPMAFMNLQEADYRRKARYLSIKINQQNFVKTISFIENTYKQFSPYYPFNYSFFETTIKQAYIGEKRFESVVRIFSIIAICIACLGLYGLAKFNLEKRVKEIGIRKVNGARVSEILVMLNQDFVKWVIVAFIIATPIAYFIISKWLENFAYKIKMSWWIFVLSGALALIIAIVTVSWKTWRAATRNPVEALRYE